MPDVRMSFIGDTYVQRPNPDEIFEPNRHHFREADVLFCNLETVVADEQYLPPHDTMRRFPRTDEHILSSYLSAGAEIPWPAKTRGTLSRSTEGVLGDSLGVAASGK